MKQANINRRKEVIINMRISEIENREKNRRDKTIKPAIAIKMFPERKNSPWNCVSNGLSLTE